MVKIKKGREVLLPEDRGGSTQDRVTLAFKTFDLGQVHMHLILHLFFFLKKSLIRLLGNTLSKIQFSWFHYMKPKEQVHCRWSWLAPADEAAPTCFPCLDPLGTQQRSGSEEQAAPQHKTRYFSTTVCKAIWFFKGLGGEALRHPQLQQFCWATGEQSSRHLALCSVNSSQQQHFPKDHQAEWKDTDLRGLWHSSNPAAPLAQPKWWALVSLEDRGRQLGRKQNKNKNNFRNLRVSLSRWDMLATLLLQCLTEAERSLTELLLRVARYFQLLATCHKTPGKKPTAICVPHFHIWKGCAKSLPKHAASPHGLPKLPKPPQELRLIESMGHPRRY